MKSFFVIALSVCIVIAQEAAVKPKYPFCLLLQNLLDFLGFNIVCGTDLPSLAILLGVEGCLNVTQQIHSAIAGQNNSLCSSIGQILFAEL